MHTYAKLYIYNFLRIFIHKILIKYDKIILELNLCVIFKGYKH